MDAAGRALVVQGDPRPKSSLGKALGFLEPEPRPSGERARGGFESPQRLREEQRAKVSSGKQAAQAGLQHSPGPRKALLQAPHGFPRLPGLIKLGFMEEPSKCLELLQFLISLA